MNSSIRHSLSVSPPRIVWTEFWDISTKMSNSQTSPTPKLVIRTSTSKNSSNLKRSKWKLLNFCRIVISFFLLRLVGEIKLKKKKLFLIEWQFRGEVIRCFPKKSGYWFHKCCKNFQEVVGVYPLCVYSIFIKINFQFQVECFGLGTSTVSIASSRSKIRTESFLQTTSKKCSNASNW